MLNDAYILKLKVVIMFVYNSSDKYPKSIRPK